MTNHDAIREFLKSKELVESISPKFSELTLDIQQIMEKSNNPMFIGALLFKLAEERDKTNKLVEQFNDKIDRIMLELKTQGLDKGTEKKESHFNVLAEQDQKILSEVERKGISTAEEIQAVMSYKGRNAASQRLNRLVKEGFLKKVQSGRKVSFLPF